MFPSEFFHCKPEIYVQYSFIKIILRKILLLKGEKLSVKRHLYVVWQKSNETDFLLTTNYILFTNQGYPLQNSSLGQLHSDS